jgi:hypothetical protein
MPADKPSFLTGLAQDVIQHGDCKGCKVNAAMGLAALGRLDDFLVRTGLPDPRPPEVPFDLVHKDPAPPRLADPETLYELRLTVSAPEAPTQDDVDRLLDQLAADLGSAVAGSGARLHNLSRRGARPGRDQE